MTTAQASTAMSDEDLKFWIAYHERQIDHDRAALDARNSAGPGVRSKAERGDLASALRESFAAARTASLRRSTAELEALREELTRRERHDTTCPCTTETPKETP